MTCTATPGYIALQVEMENGDDTHTSMLAATRLRMTGRGLTLRQRFRQPIRDDAFDNEWHHVAVVYRKPQMKIYVDQYRVLTVPDAKFVPQSLVFEGIGDQEKPITFRNVRVASGGGMNMVGKKFTDAKIVTHGINFDVDKATLRPESMGTLNQIKAVMASDPTLKFEIDGHTDNSWKRAAQPHALAGACGRREGAAGLDGHQRRPADDEGLWRHETDCLQRHAGRQGQQSPRRVRAHLVLGDRSERVEMTWLCSLYLMRGCYTEKE